MTLIITPYLFLQALITRLFRIKFNEIMKSGFLSA